MTPELLAALRQEDARFIDSLVTIAHEYERGAMTGEQMVRRIEELQEESKRRLHAITDPIIAAHHAR